MEGERKKMRGRNESETLAHEREGKRGYKLKFSSEKHKRARKRERNVSWGGTESHRGSYHTFPPLLMLAAGL